MDQTNIKKLITLKQSADNAYFNTGSPIMTDNDYDGLCNQIHRLNLSISNEVGCLPKLEKIQLPIYMGSLTKHNDNKAINNFLDKFNHESFIVQEKLDGISCLYVFKNNKIQLYTRGNGIIGTDITHLLEYGLKVPQILSTKHKIFMVRGELIISKQLFKEKYSIEFKNIRNMVSGQVSKKYPNKSIVADIEFITYEVIEPQLNEQKRLVEQYQFLKQNNFKVVYNRQITRKFLTQETLTDYLNRRKNKSLYDIDGLVITINKTYKRNDSDNPKYSFAFKIQGEVIEATVNHVKWNLSKSGKYKPQIFINPVNLNGVTISSLTGFNAKYIVNNKITCGTVLSIIRSGDVIPHILTVLKDGEPNLILPENSKWNSVDLYHNFDKVPDEMVIKQIVYFFSSLKCLNCKDKTILKIYNAGYKTIESIIQAQPEKLSQVNGIGEKLAIKLLDSIHSNIKQATIHEMLAALNCFGEGIGLKKIQNIDLNNPYNLQVKGLSETTIKEKILPVWDISLLQCENIKKLVGDHRPFNHIENTENSGPFKDQIFVFTGFRDALLEKQINELGGKVTLTISKKTTDLIIASKHNTKSSTKLIKAKELGLQITIKSDFIKKVNKELEKITKKYTEIDYNDYCSSEED